MHVCMYVWHMHVCVCTYIQTYVQISVYIHPHPCPHQVRLGSVCLLLYMCPYTHTPTRCTPVKVRGIDRQVDGLEVQSACCDKPRVLAITRLECLL